VCAARRPHGRADRHRAAGAAQRDADHGLRRPGRRGHHERRDRLGDDRRTDYCKRRDCSAGHDDDAWYDDRNAGYDRDAEYDGHDRNIGRDRNDRHRRDPRVERRTEREHADPVRAGHRTGCGDDPAGQRRGNAAAHDIAVGHHARREYDARHEHDARDEHDAGGNHDAGRLSLAKKGRENFTPWKFSRPFPVRPQSFSHAARYNSGRCSLRGLPRSRRFDVRSATSRRMTAGK
jgi:hypothetical protein